MHGGGGCVYLVVRMGSIGCLDPDGSGQIDRLGDFFNHGMNDHGALLHRSRDDQGDKGCSSDDAERLHLDCSDNFVLGVCMFRVCSRLLKLLMLFQSSSDGSGRVFRAMMLARKECEFEC